MGCAYFVASFTQMDATIILDFDETYMEQQSDDGRGIVASAARTL
jgi:hypothetical protein